MATTGTEVRELTVDSEFAGLCPSLRPEELSLLEAALERDGCRDPIIVWANHEDTILDGHNRYRFCRRFSTIFRTKAIVLADRNACRNWIIDNQLARRNCTEEQKSYLRGQRYVTVEKSQGERKDLTSGNDYPKLERTSEKLAEEYGVSEKTIRNDAKYAEAIDSIGKASGQKAKQSILSGELKLKKKDAVKLAALPKEAQKAAIQGGAEAVKKAVAPPKEKPRYPYSDAFNKWLDLVREELGGIRHQFGSLTEMMNHKRFDRSQIIYVRQMLGGLHVLLGELKQEADEYVADLAKSLSEAMTDIRDRYLAAGEPHPYTTADLARWAIKNRLWKPQPELLLDACAADFAEALRGERHVDPQGRKVRTSHCARVTVKDDEGKSKQVTFWDKIGDADYVHMTKALMQRRNQIRGDCMSLNNDRQSYNDNHCPTKNEAIQISFDFTADLVNDDD